MKYFFKAGDEETGPFSLEGIRQRFSAPGQSQGRLVRREDSLEWVPMDSLPAPVAARPEANTMAELSVLLGVISLPLLFATLSLGVPLFWITSITGIILGHSAMRRINRSTSPVAGHSAARWGLWMNYTAAIILPILLAFLLAVSGRISAKGNQTIAISNCRQIITALKIYASAYSGSYPCLNSLAPHLVLSSSNDAFRELFREEVLTQEHIFGSPLSTHNPDGIIGSAPLFERALERGENHWAYTNELYESAEPEIPLVFENPAIATWPPEWTISKAGSPTTKAPGRSWPGGRIIIGQNDSSVSAMKLEDTNTATAKVKPLENGKPVFPPPTGDEKFSILNIAK